MHYIKYGKEKFASSESKQILLLLKLIVYNMLHIHLSAVNLTE